MLNELNAIGQDTALLHFFFKEDPDDWDDEKYARRRARLQCALEVMKTTGIRL